ncbi:hypothetical protein CLU79DRAFT_806723 [Phycomyces nitens]|nr:hypothetical protein CLU79DRAFT_806723 [Phycomyces nitens]
MPKSSCQARKSHTKTASPSNSTKPIPGKRIMNINLSQENIKGISDEYLGAPISAWTSPKNLIDSIHDNNMIQATPLQALDHIKKSWQNIEEAKGVSSQLGRYASNCYKYSMEPRFSEEFINLYTAKQARVQDHLLEKSHNLYSKAIEFATEIIYKALEAVKESTLREIDSEHYKAKNASKDETMAANNDYEELMGPARALNHSQNQPKLSTTYFESVQKRCFIAISSVSPFLIPDFLREVLDTNRTDQKALKGLNTFPNVLHILKQVMDDDVEYATFPQFLWEYQILWKLPFFSTIAIIMTDFWGLFKRTAFNRDHERTFWVEYVVPIFKHFSIMNNEVIFSWCESMVLSHSNSQMVPGVWNNTPEKLFADGLGRKDGFEIIIMESSRPYSVENIDHSMGDTWKLITMTTNSLRTEILKYQDASIETVKGLSVFGIQCIRDKITLIKTSLCTPTKWQVVELRSATIPVTWDSRANMVLVFELLSTLQNEYDTQKKVLKRLQRENSFLNPIDEKDRVRYQFENSDLLE